MAAVPPLTGNKCLGTYVDGSPNRQMYCLKGYDDGGNPIYTCAKWRLFKVNCSKINQLCSNLSQAYVAAVTVCNQHLY